MLSYPKFNCVVFVYQRTWTCQNCLAGLLHIPISEFFQRVNLSSAMCLIVAVAQRRSSPQSMIHSTKINCLSLQDRQTQYDSVGSSLQADNNRAPTIKIITKRLIDYVRPQIEHCLGFIQIYNLLRKDLATEFFKCSDYLGRAILKECVIY